MDLIIKGGTIVTAKGQFKADVAVDNEKIVAIGKDLPFEADKVEDATGLFVLPGAIDAHTHMQMPFGGTVSADSYLSGSRAAVCGGVTTFFDYPVQHKGETIMGLVNSKKEICETDACSDYAFHCCITNLNDGQILDEMADAVKEGITSFKCFLVYKKEGMMVDDGTLCQLLLRAKELGAMINVHAENPDIIDLRTAKYLKEGKTSAWYHYMTRPEFVAAEADKRVVHWARSMNAPVYIVHMSDKEGLDEVIKAKTEGYEVYVETCPQYLEFTCDVFKREDGRNFILNTDDINGALVLPLENGGLTIIMDDNVDNRNTILLPIEQLKMGRKKMFAFSYEDIVDKAVMHDTSSSKNGILSKEYSIQKGCYVLYHRESGKVNFCEFQ